MTARLVWPRPGLPVRTGTSWRRPGPDSAAAPRAAVQPVPGPRPSAGRGPYVRRLPRPAGVTAPYLQPSRSPPASRTPSGRPSASTTSPASRASRGTASAAWTRRCRRALADRTRAKNRGLGPMWTGPGPDSPHARRTRGLRTAPPCHPESGLKGASLGGSSRRPRKANRSAAPPTAAPLRPLPRGPDDHLVDVDIGGLADRVGDRTGNGIGRDRSRAVGLHRRRGSWFGDGVGQFGLDDAR